MESLFLKKDVINILGRPTKGAQKKNLDIPEEKQARYSTRVVVPKCREAAEIIWGKDLDIPIGQVADLILFSKIAKKKNGKPYAVEKIQAWIRDLWPNPRQGPKPRVNKESEKFLLALISHI